MASFLKFTVRILNMKMPYKKETRKEKNMGKTDTKQQALSSMGYFFLRMAFGKESYPESVTGELQWVVDELMSDDPDADLLQAIGEELREGAYQNESGVFPYTTLQENLMIGYGYGPDETGRIVDRLRTLWASKTPLIILVGKSGTGKTSAARRVTERYELREAESYTTRPARNKQERGHSFITEEAFNQIPKDEIMAYLEYRGYRYCATRELLNASDLYVVHPEGYETLRERYRDRPMLCIKLTAPKEIREARMRERGSSEEEIKDRLELDEEVFRTIQADASIDTGNLTVEAVACRIYSLFLEAVRADKSEIRRKYLRLRLSDIDWDTGNGNATSKADASKLPKEIIVADRFLDRDYRNKTGRLDIWSLEDAASDWLSNEYGVPNKVFYTQVLPQDDN